VLKRVTWRSWAVPAALLAVFIVLGEIWHASGPVENWIFKIGTLGATFAPLLLTGIYTATGLRGATKWWTNDLGTALIQSLLSIIVIAGPLCWAVWLNQGSITGGLVAWLEIAGPLLSALTILRLCYVFVRIHRAGNGQSSDDGSAGP
jgi:hypothetical protein